MSGETIYEVAANNAAIQFTPAKVDIAKVCVLQCDSAPAWHSADEPPEARTEESDGKTERFAEIVALLVKTHLGNIPVSGYYDSSAKHYRCLSLMDGSVAVYFIGAPQKVIAWAEMPRLPQKEGQT